VTLKELRIMLEREERRDSTEQQPELTMLLQRLRGKSFEQFWEIIGRPVKPSTGKAMPIFPYESELIDTLTRKKRLAILKAAGLGISECITIRWLIWKCVVNSDWKNGQAVVINSPRIQQSIDIVTRMKKLFTPHNIYFDTKSTILEINGCTIMALPGNNLPSARSLPNCKAVILEEASFWDNSLQREALDTAERYIGKNDAFIVLISTSNRPGDLMEKLFLEPEETCIYERRRLDYRVGENLIYTPSEILEARRSFSFSREYETRAVGMMGTTFKTDDILKAQSFSYNPDEIPAGNYRVISVDPAWGSSNTGILVSEFRDSRVAILFAEEYPHETPENMVDLICDLYQKYYPIYRINVDSSQISFIKSCKRALSNQLREDIDYENQIKMFKDNKCDWRLNMRLQPIYFNESNNKNMLSHVRTFLENGWLMIDKRFDKLLIALHTCSDIEGRINKNGANAMSHDDIFDCLRESLTCYGDFTW
jgi:hypothetical protein